MRATAKPLAPAPLSTASASAGDLDRRIGARIHALRADRALSLEGLAAAAGVSRAMLSRVERGESSPTAQLLNRIAAGLGIGLSALLAEPPAATDPLCRREEQPVWQDPASLYRRRAVSPAGTASALEIVEVEFPPGGRVGFDNRGLAGRDQMLWLLDGRLRISLGEAVFDLAPGDCLHTGLDRPIVFHNPGPLPARYVVMIGPLERDP